MTIEHVALWARDLEALKAFYVEWFGALAGERYENKARGFRSYFLSFDSGARLEIMAMDTVADKGPRETPQAGYAHLAISVASREAVIDLTDRLRAAGINVVSGPRQTGDGYFESCVLDPEGNRIEITA
jgi:lactoylglutathione lyase